MTVIALLAIGGGIVWWSAGTGNRSLPQGITVGDYRAAQRRLQQQRSQPIDDADVFAELARQSLTAGQWQKGLTCLKQIPPDHPRHGHWALARRADCFLELRHARSAEAALKELLRRESNQPTLSPQRLRQARDRMDYLLVLQLRFEERQTLLRQRMKLGEADRFDVLEFCFPSLQVWNHPHAVEELEAFYRTTPDDLRLRIALGRYRCAAGEFDEARRLLPSCCREARDDGEFQAALLECLWRRRKWEAMQTVIERSSEPTAESPSLLLQMHGRFYLHKRELQAAQRCFEMILNNDATNMDAHQGLIRVYRRRGHSRKLHETAHRARALARIRNCMSWAQKQPHAIEPFQKIAHICQQAGFSEQARLIASLLKDAGDKPSAVSDDTAPQHVRKAADE